MAIAVGTIPEKISYVYAASKDVHVGCYWDIDDYSDSGFLIKVFPTFPVGSNLDKDLEKAKSWVKDNNSKYDNVLKKYIECPEIVVDTEENKPIKDVRLLSLGGEGGRAYKILINGKYYVDLREDVLVDIMIKVGVDAGGILKGEYIWAKLGNQMRLVRIGSELHKILEDSNKKKDMPKIPKDQLELGGVYKNRKGEMGVFLGYINTVLFTAKKDCYDNFEFETIPIKKAMLFFNKYNKDLKFYLLNLSEKTIYENSFCFRVCKNHNYLLKVDNINLEKDYITMVRKYYVDYFKNEIIKVMSKNNLRYAPYCSPIGFERTSKSNLCADIVYFSDMFNMYKLDEKQEIFDVKKYLVFS